MFGLERKPIKHVEPEKWYIAVDCAKCCIGIAFAEAPPQRSDPLQRRTISNLKCPHCGYVDTYAPAVMSLRRAAHVSQSDAQAARTPFCKARSNVIGLDEASRV